MRKIAYLCYVVFFLAFATQLWYAASEALTFTMAGKIAIVTLQVSMFIMGTVANVQTLSKQAKKKNIRFAQIVLFLLFLGNLVYLLFFDPDFGRTNLVDYTLVQYMRLNVNIIPLHSIRLFVNGYRSGIVTWEVMMLNLVGNFMVFMPFAYFFPLFFKSQRKFTTFFLTMLLMIISVEIIQVATQSGSGDVDDIILNFLGVMSIYIIFKLPFINRLIYGDDIHG